MKTAYRYLITDSTGSLAKQCEVGKHIVDWQFMGDEHTWTVMDMQTMEVTGTMTGTYVDRGVIRYNKFVPQPEAD